MVVYISMLDSEQIEVSRGGCITPVSEVRSKEVTTSIGESNCPHGGSYVFALNV